MTSKGISNIQTTGPAGLARPTSPTNRSTRAVKRAARTSRADMSGVHKPQSMQGQLVKPTETQVRLPSRAGREDRAGGAAPFGKASCPVFLVPQPARVDQQREELQGRKCVNEACTSCHGDARAVLAGHAGARKLLTCHDPHGSSTIAGTCMPCSVSAATSRPTTRRRPTTRIDNKSNRMFGRSCVNCHSTIHGSNHPSGQFFMR